MHCRTCGKEVNEQAVACPGCGVPPLLGNQYCQSCGEKTLPAAVACIKCGVALAQGRKARSGSGDVIVASDPPKDPVLMAVLSSCIVGLGQIVLGQTLKGITILVGSFLLACVTMGGSLLITAPLAIIDAYKIAQKLKEGKTVTQWEWF